MLKRVIIILFIGLSLSTCASHQPAVSAQVRYAIIPESPRPGDPVTIGVNAPIKEVAVFVNGKQVSKAACFTIPEEGWKPGFTAAIVTIPSTVEAQDAIIKLNNTSGTIFEIPITLSPREFLSETLVLNPTLSKLVGESSPEKEAESAKLWEILTTTGKEVYNPGKLVLPVTSLRRTSLFGTRRINQYSNGRKTTSIHAGVDFGVPKGTEVRACGRGKVVFARMRILTGYTVIIELAPGVYSSYYHLDSIISQEGSMVEAGEVVALSGSTGFSTGPHLHWELRVGTENTDPDILTERALLDKDLIISKIYK
jgi:murein DD-endopeptidase MepM/ murein hydrolase activator NlpD